MSLVHLSDRAAIEITGADRLTFLEGLLTNSVIDLEDDKACYAGLLTPQGKVIEAMLLFARGDSLFVDLAASVKDALVRRLTMYKLRAHVTIIDRSADTKIVVNPDGTAPDGALAGNFDPRDTSLGWRGVVAADTFTSEDRESYDQMRMAKGIPESDEMAREKDFWLETAAERANGVSFTKGCYVGQELTARMKHRSSPKKMILPVRIAGPLAAGDEAHDITDPDGKKAGQIRASAALEGETIGLAYLKLDYQDKELMVGGKPLSLLARYE